MIFRNPAGAPELACDECGCRWFDRRGNACYECGAPVPPDEAQRFAAVLAEWTGRADAGAPTPRIS
jgi:hypothetical protein